ncbi:ADP-glyceromanno-heptose 6-epimerase [Candidatus Binatia bacterium]|nr:ADP-glyceromanno-heptose 6-epimerase [Candidatus Binatia bacterium]
MIERSPDFADARILVTGGAGFIGSAVVWALNREGARDVWVADILGDSDKWRNLAALDFREYLEADDLLPRLEDGRLERFDFVFHLGACSSTTERAASFLFRNNTDFTCRLAAAALARGTRFVYASSAATYGDGGRGMDDNDPNLRRLRPLNMYGYSKHLFDLYAQREGWLERIAGLKYFNVFGPNEDHKGDMRSVVHKAYGQVLETGTIRLFKSYRPDYPDGGQQRDFLYVKDAAAMTLHLARTAEANGIFNVGSGTANPWLALARAVFAAMQREPRIEFIDMPESLRAKYQYFTRADIGRLRASGYVAAVTPLAEAVADYVRNYLMHDRRLGDEPEL